MKRVPKQTVLPFARKDAVLNRQIRQRAEGVRVQPGPGRPKKKRAKKTDERVPHAVRHVLGANSALHITMRVGERVPNLRTRKRYNVIKNAFIKFCGRVGSAAPAGFRLVHFSVLSNHLHFIVEADGKEALSRGMQKVLHSISRRLNALNVAEHGGSVSTLGGRYGALRGWLGRIFVDRYHSHFLKTATEKTNAVRYVLTNAEHHYGTTGPDVFSSIGLAIALRSMQHVAVPEGSSLRRSCTLVCRQLT